MRIYGTGNRGTTERLRTELVTSSQHEGDSLSLASGLRLSRITGEAELACGFRTRASVGAVALGAASEHRTWSGDTLDGSKNRTRSHRRTKKGLERQFSRSWGVRQQPCLRSLMLTSFGRSIRTRPKVGNHVHPYAPLIYLDGVTAPPSVTRPFCNSPSARALAGYASGRLTARIIIK